MHKEKEEEEEALTEHHSFLTSTLDGGEWSASLPGHFTPRERDPCIHWIADITIQKTTTRITIIIL
jgi:hypothetical protein